MPNSRTKHVTGKASSKQVSTSKPINNPNTVSNYHKTQTGAVHNAKSNQAVGYWGYKSVLPTQKAPLSRIPSTHARDASKEGAISNKKAPSNSAGTRLVTDRVTPRGMTGRKKK